MKITPLPRERDLFNIFGSTLSGGEVPVWSNASNTWVPGTAGVTDHGALTGLADDDHSAYLKRIEGGQDTISAHGNMGATETFDPTAGNVHTATANAACTITLGAPVGSGAATLELYITQDGTGGWDLTWPGSVVWPGGVDPVPDTTASTLTRYVLESLDGGTTWYGVMVGAGGATSPLTTKGDLWGYSTLDARVPAGANLTVLTGDSTAALGISYKTLETLGRYELLMAGGITSPPEPLENGTGDDWLWVFVPG